MKASEDIRYERALALLEAPLGDELVTLDADRGTCFGFNSVAASVWRLIETPRTVAEIEASLCDEYDVAPAECAIELAILLDQLVAKGLARRSDSPAASRFR